MSHNLEEYKTSEIFLSSTLLKTFLTGVQKSLNNSQKKLNFKYFLGKIFFTQKLPMDTQEAAPTALPILLAQENRKFYDQQAPQAEDKTLYFKWFRFLKNFHPTQRMPVSENCQKLLRQKSKNWYLNSDKTEH